MTSKLTTEGASFALKSVNINVSRTAAPKLALVPASRYNCHVNLMSVLCFVRIERGLGGPMTSNLTSCLFFARKPENINVLRSAAPKLAFVPASRYYCDVNNAYLNVCAKIH